MNLTYAIQGWAKLAVLLCLLASPTFLRAEAMLQLFNVSYADVIQKMPEIAEAGYNSLWLPPPTKGSGGLSVGYDMWDPFDLGSKDQRNSVRTRYGTEAELLHMVEVAHRFGIRVYFDNIMNHRAFDIPGFDENTPTGGENQTELYPGMVPEDFHLRKTEDGFYRKWDNTRDWSSSWEVQNLGLADLIDIAHETPNANHGRNMGNTHPKYSFVRDLNRPEQYDKDKDGNTAYFGVLIDQARAELVTGGNANPSSEQIRLKARDYILANRNAFVEDVGAYLIRAARWKIDRTKADGLRLDAVKHVPDYFFGKQSGADKDSSNDGYLGGVQWQFDRTRGFGPENPFLTGFNNDTNKRDSVFEDKRPRNDALVFGEHLGQPPGYGGYWDAGMRLVDNDLRSQLNNRLGNPGANLNGLDSSGAGGFGQGMGVTHANSHDSDFAAQKEWQHAYYMTREGMGLIYSDGYNKAETLGESGGAFPRHANTAYLGQFGDPRIPNILKLHNDFARGLQQGRWADGDYLAFERRDNRNPDGSTRTGSSNNEITMVMMMNDNTVDGQARGLTTSFPSDAYLYQYAEGPNGSGMVGFYKYARELGSVIVPKGGYFLFSYRTPETSTLWNSAITFYQTNSASGRIEEVPRIAVTRKDGRDGDQSFNPYGLANRGYATNLTPPKFSYQTTVPVVKGSAPVTIVVRADGSAENILLKLDGGVDINSHLGLGDTNEVAKRDNPPGLRTDVYLGYEQPRFVDRQHPEKFAAQNVARNQTGSAGAETYRKTIGATGFIVNEGPVSANNYNSYGGLVPIWVYHDPAVDVGGIANPPKQFDESGTDIVIWAKSNEVGGGFKMFVYYTLDGSYPEGAGGIGRGTTRVAEVFWKHNQEEQDNGVNVNRNWWGSANIPKPALGAAFIYKIGCYKEAADSWWPGNSDSVAYKQQMLTTFRVADFNPTTVQYFPHNDYARVPTPGQAYSNWPWAMRTGLAEGFHVLRARAFLPTGKGGRSLDAAPLYQTFTQTFYYDAQTPLGILAFPEKDGDRVGGSGYEMVVRTDMTVEEVWYRITDSDGDNDDTVTRRQNGNGVGFEPFVDSNSSNTWNAGESFTDLNGNGTYDSELNPTWAKATEVTPSPSIISPHQKEWRFTYNNIPLTNTATITLRLLEASSSRNLSLGEDAAHVREITRQVQTLGSAERILIAFPTNDGDTVDDNYVMQVWFPKSISNGSITPSQMINRFTLSAQGVTQDDRTGWTINYGDFGPGGAFHQLSIPLPNLYNSALAQQELRVVYQDPGDANKKYTAIRRVVVNPSNKPFIRITRPTVVGSDGRPTEILLPDGPGADVTTYEIQVETSTNVVAAPILTGITTTNSPTSVTSGNIRTWNYTWAINSPGSFTIGAEAVLGGTTPTKTTRNATVILRQTVNPSGLDNRDDDHDGLLNIDETSRKALPTGNVETWDNGGVHVYYATGRSSPTSPDSDGDGLPDGLEVGWRTASTNTVATADTNQDGYPNFIGDLDPPLYAVIENHPAVPGVRSQSQGDDRARQAAGSVTDPTNPDSDGDGLPDGVEDANRNGWTDGDGRPLQLTATIAQYTNNANRPNLGDWPDNTIDSFETWRETTATKADSDGDGLPDGFGEDKNLNGKTDLALLYADGTTKLLLLDLEADTSFAIAGSAYRSGDATARGINYGSLLGVKSTNQPVQIIGGAYRVDGTGTGQTNGWPKIVINETDPLRTDTDEDGLPDGWEVNHSLDPLDNGTYSFRLGGPGNVVNGPDGDPDNDGVNNATELANGTHPNQANTGGGGGSGEGVIRIGQFTDWTHQDLLVLDEYNEGNSNGGADVYRTNASDNSRDIVAFSFRDGGIADGKVYFRIDFMDLAADAWQSQVDAYIVIDTGNPAVGECAIPNEVDIATDMRWEVVVAAYQQDFGSIFIDTNRSSNTTDEFQNLANFGVVSRGFGSGNNRIAWSSRYDAVEISVDRQHLVDGGWGGDPETLNFQVFTTMPNTQGSDTGDLAGRNDIRDTIYDDWLASDWWRDQDNIRINGKLSGYFGRSSANDRHKYAKVMLLAHGNQALHPAGSIHALIHNGAATNATGYHRLLATHESHSAPLTLHLTPTLASALQWAKSTDPRTDGPAFNQRLQVLRQSGRLNLLGSTFADHMPKYFPSSFNQASKALADRFLDTIYGEGSPAASRKVFWAPERVLDADTLAQVEAMGYDYVFADQTRHFLKWFGRSAALSTEGFRLNQVGNLKVIPIHDFTSEYLDQTLDEGSSLPVRQLLSRRSRSGVQDQVVVLWRDLNDFSSHNRATSYDANVRWLATRPWIRIVTADQIANGAVQYLSNGQLTGTWGTINRNTLPAPNLRNVSKDWVDWATGENYDNWFNRLSAETFGLGSANTFGRVGVSGIANSAASAVSSVTHTNLAPLAQSVLHGAMFQTAFHLPNTNQTTDLTKFSTGDYINPANLSQQALADFARNSQSQARFAKIYEEVNTWASTAGSSTLVRTNKDVDLDGSIEYLLYNRRLFGVFEAKGGRMTAAWMRDPVSRKVWQVAGNFAAYSNTDTENEGTDNATAYRTSGFKDWWLRSSGGTDRHSVNTEYQTQAAETGIGWRFSNQNDVTKTITLASADAKAFTAEYQLSTLNKAYIRFGVSPNLEDLLLRGQTGLGNEVLSNNNRRVALTNTSGSDVVRAFVEVSLGGTIKPEATDLAVAGTSILRRNQAQTHQVEVELDGSGTHIITLGFDDGTDTPNPDSDADGLLDTWEISNFGSLGQAADADPDGDTVSNLLEFRLGSDPKSAAAKGLPNLGVSGLTPSGFTISFPTVSGVDYQVVGSTNLTSSSWDNIGPLIQGNNSTQEVTDTSASASERKFYRVKLSANP